PVSLDEEAIGRRPILDVLERRSAAQVEIDAVFKQWLVGGKIEHIQEPVVGALLGAAEEVVLLIPEDIGSGLQRVPAPVERKEVAPVVIVLDEDRRGKPVAESCEAVWGTDGWHLALVTKAVTADASKAHRGLIDRPRADRMRPVDAGVGHGGSGIYSEGRARVAAAAVLVSMVKVGVNAVLGVVEIPVYAQTPLISGPR